MQTTIRGSAALLVLLMASAAHAQDKPKDEAHKHGPHGKGHAEEHSPPGPESKGSAGEHMKRAGSEVRAAGEAANTEAMQKIEEARARTQEAMLDANQQAQAAMEMARARAAASTQEARTTMEEAREKARVAMDEARAKARTLIDEAREQTRQALLSAADSLESKEKKEEREKSRASRQNGARAEQWATLRARFHTLHQGEAKKALAIDEPMRAEMRNHARRTAKLARIRALAEQAKDTKTVERCDGLLGKELTRHEQRMNALLAKSPAADNLEPEAKPAVPPSTEEMKP